MYNTLKPAIAALLLSTGSSLAITLDSSDTTSVTSAAKTIAERVMSLYNGTESGETPGLFPSPYYWWEAGLAWDAMINYWAQTGDATYNDIVNKALSWQIGSNDDYMPANQTKSIGNDDQSTWALAAMTAAEHGFPAPATQGGNLTWVQLAENVFNDQAMRWDETTCGGGLRWQIFAFNSGYNYKNSLTNGNFYQLASRLALYTGNSTYSDWAAKVLSWSAQTGLLTNATSAVYDGFDTSSGCSTPDRIQWTASTGTYLSGAAYLQNYSATAANSERPMNLLANLNSTFTQNYVLYEVACELIGTCNVDQRAYKAMASRALARTRDLVFAQNASQVNATIYKDLNSIIQASAKGAAAQCSGGSTGSVCGTSWLNSTWDNTQGLGQELSALEIILATLPGKQMRNANSSTPVASGNSTSSGAPSTNTTSGSSATTHASTNGANNMFGSVSSLMLMVSFALVAFAM